MAFLQCSLDALCRSTRAFLQGFFRYSLTWVLEKLWYERVFFCNVLATLCTGGQQGIFAGFFRYSFTWSLEKSWYVPVFFAGCW